MKQKEKTASPSSVLIFRQERTEKNFIPPKLRRREETAVREKRK